MESRKNLRRAIKEILPPISDTLLYSSLFAAFVGISVVPYFYTVSFPRTSLLNSITYCIDPLFFHLGAMLPIAWVFYKRFAQKPSQGFVRNLVRALLISAIVSTVLLLAIEYPLEKWVLKPTFFYDRPDNPLPESPITKFATELLEVNVAEENSSTPSGFVLRQLFLLLTFFFLAQHEDLGRTNKDRIIRYSLYIINIIMFCAVGFWRVYRGLHTFLDVGISIGTGTIAFWFFIMLLISMPTRPTERKHLPILTVSSAASFVPWYFYAGEAKYISVIFLFILGSLVFAYAITSGSAPNGKSPRSAT